MANSRTSRRFRRAKKEYVWCSSILSAQAVSTSTISVPLVEAAEWERGSSGSYQKGATLLAIRGWLHLAPRPINTVDGAGYVSIVKLDFDEAASAPSAIAEYQEEDILWCGGINLLSNAAGTANDASQDGHHYELNIGSRRKLESRDVIQLQLQTNVTTAQMRVSGLIRALVALP